MYGARTEGCGGGFHSAIASLDLVHLMSSCRVAVPAPAARSAIGYIAAFLDGSGSCADLVRDCLQGVAGAAASLRSALDPDLPDPSEDDAMGFPGPMHPETRALAVLVSGRAAMLDRDAGPRP